MTARGKRDNANERKEGKTKKERKKERNKERKKKKKERDITRKNYMPKGNIWSLVPLPCL